MTSPVHGDDAWSTLASRVRSLADATVDCAIDEDTATRAAVVIAEVDADLRSFDTRRRDFSALLGQGKVVGADAVGHTEHCYVCGPRNGGGLGLVPHWEGDGIVAEVILDATHEGAPGVAHGGVVALLFDDLLSYPASARAGFVVTTDLQIKYLAPTPTRVPLTLTARFIDAVGSRFLVSGSIAMENDITAIATGWFRTGRRSLIETEQA